jgi:hypothetical protein
MSLTIAFVVLLSAWLGAALLASAVVAPAAFAVLPSRTLAGALVGRVLPVLFWSGMALGVVVALSSRALYAGLITTTAASAFALACAAAQLVVSPKIEAVRAAIGGPVDALEPGDPRRQLFGKLHGVSVLCLGAAGIAALIMLFFLIRNLKPGTAPSA